MGRKTHLTTADFAVLTRACEQVRQAFGTPPYLVGSATERADFRDVDLRVILRDEEFDALYGGRRHLWGLTCLTIGRHLSQITGLPIDFQVQRMTEANAKYPGPRNAMGLGLSEFAGGGDATSWLPNEDEAA